MDSLIHLSDLSDPSTGWSATSRACGNGWRRRTGGGGSRAWWRPAASAWGRGGVARSPRESALSLTAQLADSWVLRRQYHQLEGRESELRRLIEAEYLATLCRWAGSRHAVDERAETHLQVAALALASHKALAPWLRDEAEVLQVGRGPCVRGRAAHCMPCCPARHGPPHLACPPPPAQIIREHMGGRTHAALRFLLRATRLLHRDPYAVLQGRLRALQWDLGRGFESRLELGERQVRGGGALAAWPPRLRCDPCMQGPSIRGPCPSCPRRAR